MHWPKNFDKITSKLVWTLLVTSLDTFEISNCFRFFFELFQVSTLQGELVNFFTKKTTSEHVENMFEHFWERFRSFWKKNFSIFLKFFQVSTLQGALGTFFSRKNLKTSSKLVWILLETCLGILNSGKFLHFFEIFRLLYPPGCTGQKISKKSHQNMFGQCWKRFWTFLKIWIPFHFCGTFLSLQGALGREFFRRNNQAKHAQTMFLGTFLENFESFEVFPLFCVFCKFRPPRVHWAKIFAENLPRSMLKTCLNTFGNVFRHFEKLKVFPVFWSFSKCRPYRVHWALFSEKIAWKQVQNLCGDFQDYFWTLLSIQFFFDSFFQVLQISISRLHWARKIRKNYLKQVWTLLITFFGILNFWSLFDSCGFFLVSRVHWAELLSVEIIKQNMLKQCFWERFWTILKVSKFFHFFVFFASFDHPGCTGQKILPKKCLEACWKHVWLPLGTFFRAFWTIESFSSFFESFPSFDPPGCTEQKISIKSPQNLFGHSQ